MNASGGVAVAQAPTTSEGAAGTEPNTAPLPNPWAPNQASAGAGEQLPVAACLLVSCPPPPPHPPALSSAQLSSQCSTGGPNE